MMQYGGALFDDKCKCGRSLVMPESISVNKFMFNVTHKKPQRINAECKECGEVFSKFIGFKA